MTWQCCICQVKAILPSQALTLVIFCSWCYTAVVIDLGCCSLRHLLLDWHSLTRPPVMIQLYKDDPSSHCFFFCSPSCIFLLCHHLRLLTFRSFHTIFVNITHSFASPSALPWPSLVSFCLWHISGGHSRSNSGSSESSIPNLARSLLLVDQLIDL